MTEINPHMLNILLNQINRGNVKVEDIKIEAYKNEAIRILEQNK